MPLRVLMSPAETALFLAFAGCANNYLEWGAGGSTLAAAARVRGRVACVDSDQSWLDRVERDLESAGTRDKARLHRVDVGPVGDWGWPAGHSHRHLWPGYFEEPFRAGAARNDADLVLIDGRFRVACFARVLKSTHSNSTIMVHDYACRREYHAIGTLAREVARAENLSVFQPDPSVPRGRLDDIINQYRFDAR